MTPLACPLEAVLDGRLRTAVFAPPVLSPSAPKQKDKL